MSNVHFTLIENIDLNVNFLNGTIYISNNIGKIIFELLFDEA